MKVSNWVWRGSNTPPVEVGSFFPWFFEGFHPRCWIFSINSIKLPLFLGEGDETWCKSNGNPCGSFPRVQFVHCLGARCHIMTPVLGLLLRVWFWWIIWSANDVQLPGLLRSQRPSRTQRWGFHVGHFWDLENYCSEDLLRMCETCCWSKKSQTTTWDVNKTIKPWK